MLDKPKRGRQFGAYPQQHLRVACGSQELQAIHEAVPDTRLRAVVLLAQPTLVEAQEHIAKLARKINFAASTLQTNQDILAAQAFSRIADIAQNIAELAEAATQVLTAKS